MNPKPLIPSRPRHALLLLLGCALASLSVLAGEPPHAGIIRSWNAESLARGERLYQSICITCHGTPDQAGTLPTSRPFWKEPFKNGADPYSLYKTLTDGFGQMPAWTFLTPRDRYDAIHYIRETYVRPLNPSAYFPVTEAYLAGLPQGTDDPAADSAPSRPDQPPYLRMDFGPVLFWTLQVAPGNIAYKGLAIRLDEGPGGISKGHAWMLYDHDTLRAAAGWIGDRFVDWRGIAFDGSHNTHTSIAGETLFENPVGPGWADPAKGGFEDPRFHGRDDKPYGPLPRAWAHYQGLFLDGNKAVIAYTVGQTRVLESPGYEEGAFSRTLQIGESSQDLVLRIAPAQVAVALVPPAPASAQLATTNGFHVLRFSASAQPGRCKILLGGTNQTELETLARHSPLPSDLEPFTHGGPARWNPPIATRGKLGADQGPFAVDELTPPPDASNPWHTWMRFGAFDFFPDGRTAAICTWNGDVWLVSGVEGNLAQLTWKRIASGLFQPLGIKIVNGTIYVGCRDQIARLHDLNGDQEIDWIENFNNDHQVTEHFHEFAMGLQTDAEGNFYYAKSARHALPALVPHHGTLLKVSRDGARTEIIANGFRAANGVCINDDGTFFVTDQEGHWTPKNRINWVHRGGFYGNMLGYHDRASSADADMEQPVVWITNEMDRSPGELVRVTSPAWGPLNGMLLNLSYGTGRIFLVPTEKVGVQMQGGVVQLPLPDFPTGVMRGRFHPGNGHLYACGMYAWAGNRQSDGGFFRVRATGQPAWLPVLLHAHPQEMELRFSDPLDPAAASDPANYAVKIWDLKRSANYGSPHLNETNLPVAAVHLAADRQTVRLTIPDLRPTWGMEIKASLRTPDGAPLTRVIHNTIHALEPESAGALR